MKPPRKKKLTRTQDQDVGPSAADIMKTGAEKVRNGTYRRRCGG